MMLGYAFHMLDEMIVVLTSVDTAEQAERLAYQLLEQRLAACVQQTSGASTYHWQGKLECSSEYYLQIKTAVGLQENLVTWLEKHHPYDVPEIIVLEGTCSKAYGQWLDSSLHRGNVKA